VEDPYDLTRLDAIKAMNLAPRYDFVVALKPDILEYINTTYGLTTGGGSEAADLGRIITELGSGEEDEIAAEDADPSAPPELDETDSGIVKLANQIIIDAYNKGASDIHVEPYGKNSPTQVRLRIDGDCQKYLEIPPAHRNAIVQRFKIMAKLDIAEKRKPQDGKIRSKGPTGTMELRVAPAGVAVGEMRDHETAATGIEASLTGHLVFSTLHTNSAPETITRLLDMDIDPFNFADALLGIMAQRLVRTLCKDCKEEYVPTQEEFAELMEGYGLEYWDSLGIRY